MRRMSRAAADDITVSYRAYDGTATAGADYEAVNSSFVFAAGETTKTVSVVVLDDAHDEGSETVKFWLWGVRGLSAQQITDPYATGTIHNSDPMPQAWIARFGRTVGSQVVDAVTARFEGGTSAHVTVGGMSLDGTSLAGADPSRWPEWASESEQRGGTRTMTERELLLGSSFHLSAGERDGGGPAFAAWGRVATGGFEADVDDVRMDGDVTTGLIGLDAEWERMLAGLVLSQSKGDGSYTLSEEMGDDRGTVESTLTGVYPYARLEMSERVSAWGLAGLGTGELTLNQEGVQSGRGRNPTPSTWVPGTAQDARRHGERHVCIGILHGVGHLGINQATHPAPVRQSGRPAARAGLQDPPGPLTAVARSWRPYSGMNPSLGCKFGVQATVRTGKSLTVGFRPLPDWTPLCVESPGRAVMRLRPHRGMTVSLRRVALRVRRHAMRSRGDARSGAMKRRCSGSATDTPDPQCPSGELA